MKSRTIFAGLLGALACLALFLAAFPAAADYVTKNYMAQGGADWEVRGVLNVNQAAGGKITVNGADVTSAMNGGSVAGVANGYKIARGETALGGTNPTVVSTGLTTVVACTTTLKLTTAPGVGTSVITYGTSSGTMNLYGWKVTSNSNPTLIASTGTETVGWVCVGT